MSSTDDRDRALEAAIRAIDRADGAGTPDRCPEAEVLAAYCDAGLAAADRADVERHVARCARCQATLGALVRAERETGAGIPVPNRPRIPTWTWVAGGSVAAAAVLAAWIGIAKSEIQLARSRAQSTAAEPAAPATGAPAAATVPPADSLTALREDRDTALEDAHQRKSAPRLEAQPRATPSPVSKRANPQEDERKEADTARREAGTRLLGGTFVAAKPQDIAAAAPAPPPVAEPTAPAAAAARLASAEKVTGASERLTESLQVVEESRLRRLNVAEAKPDDVLVRTATGDVLWRISRNRLVSSSTDGGATWFVQLDEPRVDLLAASAPSVSICWVAGRGGAVRRTTNGGETWEVASLSERIDLIRIEAVDARRASVTATDGRMFATVDGGETWKEM